MKIQIPTSINDITLAQYQRYMESNTEDADDDFLLFKTIEIFCDVDIKLVSQFPIDDARDIAQEVQNVLGQTATMERTFELNGVEYGFIPDLEQMSIGEYIDLEDGLKSIKSFHKAAAVMYRPIKKQFKNLYTIEPYTAEHSMQSEIKNAPLGIISSAIVFFYNIATELLRVSQNYSLAETQKTTSIIHDKLNLAKNTDGFIPYLRLLEDARSIIEKQQK